MAYELKHRTEKKLSAGKYYPAGATPCENGVNFALCASDAKAVYLLLFDKPDGEPTDIIEIKTRDRNIWHVLVEGVKAGQLYGYKVAGEYAPAQGLRFNPYKLLLDPCAKALTGKLVNTDNLLLGYDPSSAQKDLSLDTRDNTTMVPKCIVVDDGAFDWKGDCKPDIPLEELIIYEVHVKGFTAHASSKVRQPGTYLGFIEKIPHLKELGINAVELLPVHEHYDEDFLRQRGQINYWGYNTLCFFAPEISYSTQRKPGGQVEEFKTLVRELHKAGIEVILDVVFNHTCEGNQLGPTVMFKGIDNRQSYYLTGPQDEPGRYYMDYTGCGNSLNASNGQVLTLIMNSLRYWVEVMHVDGFRFDLAAELGRTGDKFARSASFFAILQQDPVLSRVKLIAEPWDLGTYEVGQFPMDWAEWNGRFRDTVRKFVKGDDGQVPDLSARLFGSEDLYKDGRTVFESIKFVTCHDGFTLYDLVSYNGKHNERNGEENRDGTNDNNSWNCGAEGSTEDAGVNKLRRQQIKNFAICLLLARGTPMLLGGDEFGRTQQGNNNGYCQDNELTWFDWDLVAQNRDTFRFFKMGIGMLKDLRLKRKRGRAYGTANVHAFYWYNAQLQEPNWSDPGQKLLCYWIPCTPDTGFEHPDVFIMLNAQHTPAEVKLPELKDGLTWHRKIDTSLETPEDFLDFGEEVKLPAQGVYGMNPRSVVLLIGK